MKPGDVFCIPNAPGQHGALWVEVTDNMEIAVKNPAGKFWRGRIFTLDEFRTVLQQEQDKKESRRETKSKLGYSRIGLGNV